VLHVRGTKTKAATRDVPVPVSLEIPEGSGPIFLTQNGRSPSKTAQRHYWRTVTRAMSKISGQPVAKDLTPYCLRHDYCTRLQEVGVPIDVARRLMGHSSVEITSKIYTHASEAALEAARELIDGRAECDPERDPDAANR
jgi:integrase